MTKSKRNSKCKGNSNYKSNTGGASLEALTIGVVDGGCEVKGLSFRFSFSEGQVARRHQRPQVHSGVNVHLRLV